MPDKLPLVPPANDTRPDPRSEIDAALDTIRQHLGMAVAYLSEFVDGRSVFRNVSAPGLEDLIDVGDSKSLDDVYCLHILEGRLPELIPDTAKEPICAAMPITSQIPIGSHMSIPVMLPDGEAYGMFCCLSPEPNPSLNPRDLKTMRMFADLAARQVRAEHVERRAHAEKRRRIEAVINGKGLAIVYQPIVDLRRMEISGFEALSRFSAEPARTPDAWFNEATEVGLAVELETAAIAEALKGLEALPAETYLSINVSPQTLLSQAFLSILRQHDFSRIVLEITEHDMIDDYDLVIDALAELRRDGLRLAVDDAGAGHSSLRHIVQLDPDFVKLDMSLTRDVDSDLARRALVSALVFYTRETNAQIIAEGIETEAELDTLKLLGVGRGQGYYLGRPSPDAISAMGEERAACGKE